MLTLRHARASEGWNEKNLGQKGFTLVELLVVIIILGILAAVVVLAVNGLQDNGEENACKTEKRTVEAAAAAYYADNDAWPANAAAMDPQYIRDPDFNWTITNGVASGKTC
jgi:general secretion pathway protein G